jgi:hypothetical protein
MPRSSRLSQENDVSRAHSWLVEQVYEPKRERTFALVKRSVDVLLEQKERISLASIVTTSKEVDEGGRGVSESAILNNEQAHAYYEQHRSWKGTRRKGPAPTALPPQPGYVKPDRDLTQARQRYLRMGKPALVDRLLAVEQVYAEQQERWLQSQDELLQWRLRAEKAELQMKKLNRKKTASEKSI